MTNIEFLVDELRKANECITEKENTIDEMATTIHRLEKRLTDVQMKLEQYVRKYPNFVLSDFDALTELKRQMGQM